MGSVLDDQERRALLEGISSTRSEISDTIGALRGLMNQSLEWREWVRRYPWPVFGTAALIGLRLGRGRWL
jgi:hypothetical protein